MCPARTPEERALIARLANATRLAKNPDLGKLTEGARQGLAAKFEREARALAPDAPADQIARMVEDARRAHMLKMSLASRQARRKIRENVTIAEAAEAELAQLGDAS